MFRKHLFDHGKMVETAPAINTLKNFPLKINFNEQDK
jgi:hypothetical protein